jgi:hypothetical protein
MPIMATKLCRSGFDLGDKCVVDGKVCEISAVGEKNMGYKIISNWPYKLKFLSMAKIPSLLKPMEETE